MKKYRLFVEKLVIATLIGFVAVSCNRLDSIPYCCPQQTPATWCDSVPCVEIDLVSTSFVLAKPSSSFIVYLLGVVTIAVAISFLQKRGENKALLWWGISLLLWGLGALPAGTSYQAFSYEIKCRGKDICSWTSWWEIGYLILSTLSINAMVAAFAHSFTRDRLKTILTVYAIVNALTYTCITVTGAFIPDHFMVSFELMILFTLPSFCLFFAINLKNYLMQRSADDLIFLGAWAWLAATMAAYYGYLLAGITGDLWQKGVWFSENDVLHIGLIIWMIYLYVIIPRSAKISE